MKKTIKYLIIFILSFMFYHIDKAYAIVNLNIDENGEIVKDDSYRNEYDDYYTFEDGVLNLTKGSSSFSSDEAFNIQSKSDLVINASNNVHIRNISVKKNLEITSSSKNNKVYISEIMGGGESDEISIHDVTIDGLQICVWFTNFYFDNAIIDPIDSDYSVEFDGDMTIQSASYYLDGELVWQWTWDFSGRNVDNLTHSFNIKDTHINTELMYVRHGSLVMENSSIILKPRGWDYDPFLYAKNSEVTIKNSSIERGEGVEKADFEIFDSNYDATIEDATITVNDFRHYVSSGSNYFIKKDYINNSTINVDSMYGFSAIMENSTINTNKLSSGYIDAKDSTINISVENSNTNDLNLEFLKLDNSKINNPGGGQLYTSNMNETDYSIKLINNSYLELTGNASSIGSNGMYIENSTFKSNTEMIWTNIANTISPFEENNGTVTVKNSNFEANNLVARNDLKVTNSNIKLKSLKLERNDSYNIGGNLYLDNSKMYIDNDDRLGVEIYDLYFNKSYLLSKASENAWLSTIDITTHNLAGINETQSVMPMDTNSSDYSFYDNGEISKYVEIKTPLKVTFKIKNGTWKDGSKEDKIIETYYFGSIKDVDIPKEMVAAAGYESGSWDKEIVYNDLNEEYVYTYTFKTKEEKKKEEEDDKEDEPATPKVFKNPNTGSFISITTIGVLSYVCVRVLKYTRNKKPLNRL